MSHTKLSAEQAASHVKAEWSDLTDEDVHHGLRHRETFLDRLCHRHHLNDHHNHLHQPPRYRK